jgi:hypothetical protein
LNANNKAAGERKQLADRVPTHNALAPPCQPRVSHHTHLHRVRVLTKKATTLQQSSLDAQMLVDQRLGVLHSLCGQHGTVECEVQFSFPRAATSDDLEGHVVHAARHDDLCDQLRGGGAKGCGSNSGGVFTCTAHGKQKTIGYVSCYNKQHSAL